MTDLYPRLVGEVWQTLPAAVRALHEGGPQRHANGTFTVTSSPSWLGRLVIRCFGLPRPGQQLALSLVVDVGTDGEVWSRSFGGRPTVTQQYVSSGRLAERRGPIELRFDLVVDGGRLRYASVGAWLCLGRRRVRLPRWLSPHAVATEWADTGATPMQTRIQIAVPLLGPLLEYGGALEVRPAAIADHVPR